MSPGTRSRIRRVSLVAVLACAVCSCAGAGTFKREYEYEEELYLSLDGSATLNVNASVASLVALRGANLDVDPRARIDRAQLRRFFSGPDARTSVSLWRRDGRRFVHATVDVDDVRSLSRIAPFAWSDYEFIQRGDAVEFRQAVGSPGPHERTRAGSWTGDELVAFRMHLPSDIEFHNAPAGEVQRGNILEWEQPLADRLAGRPIDMRVRLGETSILANTLLLFGSTAAAALLALAAVVWWISRRGRDG